MVQIENPCGWDWYGAEKVSYSFCANDKHKEHNKEGNTQKPLEDEPLEIVMEKKEPEVPDQLMTTFCERLK